MNKAIRSPIYLAGNKFKLYQTIRPHLIDNDRNVFVDLFGGSLTMTLNVANDNLFEQYHVNEKSWWLNELYCFVRDVADIDLKRLSDLNSEYGKEQSEYLRLQRDYNDSPNTSLLYLLMCRGFSNQVRFNASGKHDLPWGNRKPFFLERIKVANDLLTSRNVSLNCEHYDDYLDSLPLDLSNHTIYIDPPYRITNASYNEKGGWTIVDDIRLLQRVIELRNRGAKIVMSNVFHNKGKSNQELIDWCDKNSNEFVVHHLNFSYNNCSSFKSEHETDEVLITSR